MNSFKLFAALIVLAFAINSFAFAKGEEFRVLVSKGTVQVQREGKGAWENLKTGSYLYSKDNLKLNSGAYLSLVHTKGRPVEVKKEGNYTVANLAKDILNSKTKLSALFANYVIDQISDADAVLGSKGHKANMETTGAVERSINTESLKDADASMPFAGNTNTVKVKTPRKVTFTKSDITLQWFKVPNAKEYEFILTDRFDRPEFSKIVTDTSITLNSATLKLTKDSYYFWKVKVANRQELRSEEACFVLLSDNKVAAINDTLKMLREELGNVETAPAKIIMAGFYEQNNLLEDANSSFKDAIKLAPEIEDYKRIYDDFLIRTYSARQ